MKLSSALIASAAMVGSVSASMTVSHKNAASVLRAARRLNDQADGEYAYLAKYTLKMVSCAAGQSVTSAADGSVEYDAIVFRMCPTESGCDDASSKGCGAGYGDFVVGLNTFVNAYFEDQKDNMQWDDNFNVNKYTECTQYKADDADDQYKNTAWYVGPTCTSDGADVRLGLFEDETCTAESATTFETISNGWSLPFSTGGLVSTSCIECYADQNGNGNYALRDMCSTVYASAPSKCETNMEYFSYYGQNVEGCDTVSSLMPATKKSGSGGKVFGWIVFVALVVGGGAYVVWWRKSESEMEEPLEDDTAPRRGFWRRLFRKKAGASDGIMA